MRSLFSVSLLILVLLVVFYAPQALVIGSELTKVKGAVAKGAVCLDGSPPAYQLEWGKKGANGWLVFLEGGYWCITSLQCQDRVINEGGLGSSTKMHSGEFTGILSNNSDLNPYFYNWTRVYVKYCDGSCFTGDKEEIDPITGLYYRGGRVFDAVVDELLELGMKNASNVLLSGSSAGGLATLLHCDKFYDLLPSTTRVKCLSDAGYFIHLNNASELVQLHGSATYLPSSCTSKMNASMCLHPTNVVPDIRTPVFVLNSAYDTFQVANIMLNTEYPRSCKYDLKGCPSDVLKKWKNLRLEFLQAVTDLGNCSSRGFFINSCHTHGQTLLQGKWLGDPASVLNNMSISEAVGEWYFDRKSIQLIDDVHTSPQQCVVDTSEPYPCNNYTWGQSFKCKSSTKYHWFHK